MNSFELPDIRKYCLRFWTRLAFAGPGADPTIGGFIFKKIGCEHLLLNIFIAINSYCCRKREESPEHSPFRK